MFAQEMSMSFVEAAEDEVVAAYRSDGELLLGPEGGSPQECRGYLCAVQQEEGIALFAVLLFPRQRRSAVYRYRKSAGKDELAPQAVADGLSFLRQMGFRMEEINLSHGRAMREVLVRNIPVLRPRGTAGMLQRISLPDPSAGAPAAAPKEDPQRELQEELLLLRRLRETLSLEKSELEERLSHEVGLLGSDNEALLVRLREAEERAAAETRLRRQAEEQARLALERAESAAGAAERDFLHGEILRVGKLLTEAEEKLSAAEAEAREARLLAEEARREVARLAGEAAAAAAEQARLRHSLEEALRELQEEREKKEARRKKQKSPRKSFTRSPRPPAASSPHPEPACETVAEAAAAPEPVQLSGEPETASRSIELPAVPETLPPPAAEAPGADARQASVPDFFTPLERYVAEEGVADLFSAYHPSPASSPAEQVEWAPFDNSCAASPRSCGEFSLRFEGNSGDPPSTPPLLLLKGLNVSRISPDGRSPQPCTVRVEVFPAGSGLDVRVVVATEDGREFTYTPERQPETPEACTEAVHAAVTFAENVGFWMEIPDLAAILVPAGGAEVSASCG